MPKARETIWITLSQVLGLSRWGIWFWTLQLCGKAGIDNSPNLENTISNIHNLPSTLQIVPIQQSRYWPNSPTQWLHQRNLQFCLCPCHPKSLLPRKLHLTHCFVQSFYVHIYKQQLIGWFTRYNFRSLIVISWTKML